MHGSRKDKHGISIAARKTLRMISWGIGVFVIFDVSGGMILAMAAFRLLDFQEFSCNGSFLEESRCWRRRLLYSNTI
jgi:hypothetical protein